VKATVFKWNSKRQDAALLLAEGHTQRYTAEKVNKTEKTIWTWANTPEFSEEVDRLSIMVGVASRAERLRITNRAIRQFVKGQEVDTKKDILDWLKFAQSETDGAKLDLTALLEAHGGNDS